MTSKSPGQIAYETRFEGEPRLCSTPWANLGKRERNLWQRIEEAVRVQIMKPVPGWRETGEPDPHAARYDCTREQLPGGHFTDDQVAFALGMTGRKDLDFEGVLSMGKDRIRWLSRRLHGALASLAAAVDEGNRMRGTLALRDSRIADLEHGHANAAMGLLPPGALEAYGDAYAKTFKPGGRHLPAHMAGICAVLRCIFAAPGSAVPMLHAPTTTSGGGAETEAEAPVYAAFKRYVGVDPNARPDDYRMFATGYLAGRQREPTPTARHGVAGGDAGLREALEKIRDMAPTEDPGALSGWDAPMGNSEDIGQHHADVARYETGMIAAAALKEASASNGLRIVFDAPLSPEMPRFVEVEDSAGRSVRAGEWHSRPDGLWELRLAALTPPAPPAEDDTERCIACDKPFVHGDMVLSDANGGTIHASCCGPERESYTGRDGEPLKLGEPLPAGCPWQPSPRVSGDREAIPSWFPNPTTALDKLAVALLAEFQRVEPNHSISQNPASWVATFVDIARVALASSPPAEMAGVEEARWRPMDTAPHGKMIVARHKPNKHTPHGWIGTITCDLDDPDEHRRGGLDTILHYNGDVLQHGFHGCWLGWMWPEELAALRTRQDTRAGGAVEGWQMVPREPTDEMWDIFDEYNGDRKIGYNVWLKAWAAMLDAAPATPTGTDDGEGA